MSRDIRNIAELEAVVGKTPEPMRLKVIDHLDAGALRWAAAAPVMFAAFGDASKMTVTVGGPNAATGDSRELRLRREALDDPSMARPGQGFGSLFLLPGVTETMRINGRITAVDGKEIRIAVEECYGHCGKALIRSAFWAASPVGGSDDPASFVDASRFMALATIDARGCADLSPKGDPAGKMMQLEAGQALFADRPGNRRADSFRNILTQPRVAAALLIPGSTRIALLAGSARLTTDEGVRARFAVQDKNPALAIVIDDLAIELRDSRGLRQADLWPAKPPTHGIDAARLFIDHVRLNKDRGFGGRLANAALAVPGVSGLMKKGLEKDYRDRLY